MRLKGDMNLKQQHKEMSQCRFVDEEGSFELLEAELTTGLYFPIASEKGIKSAVTPCLGGDCKTSQNQFLLEPVSCENLHNNRSSRNFWLRMSQGGYWSATGNSVEQISERFTEVKDKTKVKAGMMWHIAERESRKFQLKAKTTSFAPVNGNYEIMEIEIRNTGRMAITFLPIAAIPLYGRSADNIRDHRHVTSLLHRTLVTKHGVLVTPTLSFDERGHQENHTTYYAAGMTQDGEAPEQFYPETAKFIGEGGTFDHPACVVKNEYIKGENPGYQLEGQESIGAFSFRETTLGSNERCSFILFLGITEERNSVEKLFEQYKGEAEVHQEFEQVKEYWKNKNNVKYHTGNRTFDSYMRWINFQPELRKLFGCSFLPHHDYGKGGRGWRDLWQDCLGLLIMNPVEVRSMLINYMGGVRVDGTNATIIGTKPGEFKADRNSIPRVWMDHGMWPLHTIKFYIDQTGDFGILNEQMTYFKDQLNNRGQERDQEWKESHNLQLSTNGNIYKGSILEHLLLQNMCAFYDVGEHNHIRLRGADWNDALDMAEKRGESVAFTNAYAGNLQTLAELLRKLREIGVEEIRLMEEMQELLENDCSMYADITRKQQCLERYMALCAHETKGTYINVETNELARILENMANWTKEHIRDTEWIEGEGCGWFNGYYDNHGRKVEGIYENQVRMMLTSQVFAIMAGTATKRQITEITSAADTYLYDKDCGGYRLNTDFHEVKTDLGRMFGFAYGEKENGAVFSHMAVMYANALYSRGFAKEGYKALETLFLHSMNFEKSRIYPGIPEYFGKNGRGLYHYLTGAASWYMVTAITKMFGVHGEYGNLCIEPMLMEKQYDNDNQASIEFPFAGKNFQLTIVNSNRKSYNQSVIQSVTINQSEIKVIRKGPHSVSISSKNLESLPLKHRHEITLILN